VFHDFIGMLPEHVLQHDYLHAFSIGVVGFWAVFVVDALIHANFWQLAPSTLPTLRSHSVIRLRADLFKWYELEQSAGRSPCRVQTLTAGMVTGAWGLYGGESNSFLAFLVDLLKSPGAASVPNRATMLAAGEALFGMLTLIREHDWVFPPQACQAFVEHVRVHIRACTTLGLHFRPKHHAIVEVGSRLGYYGSPRLWATWVDEGVNSQLKALCRSSHRAVWHERILTTFNSDAYPMRKKQGRKRSHP
jgi:hypothetical protein